MGGGLLARVALMVVDTRLVDIEIPFDPLVGTK